MDEVSVLLENMGIDVLEKKKINGFRKEFEEETNGHSLRWLDDIQLLERIGAINVDRRKKSMHPTVAGLVLFGQEDKLHEVFPGMANNTNERLA